MLADIVTLAGRTLFLSFSKSSTHIVNVPYTQNPAPRPHGRHQDFLSSGLELRYQVIFIFSHWTINSEVAGLLVAFVDNWKNTVVSFSSNMEFYGNPGT